MFESRARFDQTCGGSLGVVSGRNFIGNNSSEIKHFKTINKLVGFCCYLFLVMGAMMILLLSVVAPTLRGLKRAIVAFALYGDEGSYKSCKRHEKLPG